MNTPPYITERVLDLIADDRIAEAAAHRRAHEGKPRRRRVSFRRGHTRRTRAE